MVNNRNFGRSKITVHNRNSEQSKITIHNRNFSQSKVCSTTIILDGPKFGSTTILLAGPKLRHTGGPLDHRPNGQSKFMSPTWSIGLSSKWTVRNYVSQVVHRIIVHLNVKFWKFGRSKLHHMDQGAFRICLWPPASIGEKNT